MNKKNIDICFKIFDLDHDGLITVDELKYVLADKAVISSTGETAKMVEEIMKEVDQNNDN